VILGNPDIIKRGWVKVTITIDGQAHNRLKRAQGEGENLFRRLNKQAEKFNVLARAENG
jgi:hypothetical protein